MKIPLNSLLRQVVTREDSHSWLGFSCVAAVAWSVLRPYLAVGTGGSKFEFRLTS